MGGVSTRDAPVGPACQSEPGAGVAGNGGGGQLRADMGRTRRDCQPGCQASFTL